MTTLFQEEFADLDDWTPTEDAGNTVEVVASQAQNGDGVFHVDKPNGNDDARIDRSDLSGATTLYSAFEFKILNSFNESAAPSIILHHGSQYTVIPIGIDETDEIETWVGSWVASGFSFSTDTWYGVRVKVVASTTVGTIEVWTTTDNSTWTKRVDRSGLDTGASWDDYRIGHDGAATRDVEFYVAHLYVSDSEFLELPWTGAAGGSPPIISRLGRGFPRGLSRARV